MRNPKRIKLVLSKLERIWEENPDLRLGQVLINCIPWDPIPGAHCDKLYNIEDEELLVKLEETYGWTQTAI